MKLHLNYRLILASFLLAASAIAVSQDSCEKLAEAKIPGATIALAQTVAAGAFVGPPAPFSGLNVSAFYKGLPAFCRVVAVAKPTVDSDIKLEVWLPVAGWNGKLQGLGNGGFAGLIDYVQLGVAMSKEGFYYSLGLCSDFDYLKECPDEESRLGAVIAKNYPEHLPESEIALNTGMRPSEQYGLTWGRVDLTRKIIFIPKSKNGRDRHIPLNLMAVAAFKVLQQRSLDGAGPVFVSIKGVPRLGHKHWFEPAVSEAGIKDFTWYCMRHTFASRLRMKGAPLEDIADLLGHKSLTMTRRYAHLGPNKLHTVVSLLGASDTTTDTSENGVAATTSQVAVH